MQNNNKKNSKHQTPMSNHFYIILSKFLTIVIWAIHSRYYIYQYNNAFSKLNRLYLYNITEKQINVSLFIQWN